MKFVKLCNTTSEIEALSIKALLEDEGIECIVRSYQDTAYNGIYTLLKGWGDILVREEDLERATKLLRERNI